MGESALDEVILNAIVRWLTKADHDLRTGLLAVGADPPIADTAAFHAQQCAEKSLKAFLVTVGAHIERTHDLVRLVAICAEYDSEFLSLREAAIVLTDFAVGPRYPDDLMDVSADEASKALEQAAHVKSFVAGKVRPDGSLAAGNEVE